MLSLDVLLSDFSVKVGVGCLIGHLGLVFLFRSSGRKSKTGKVAEPGEPVIIPASPWSQMPSFTAHQIMCIPVLTSLIVQGIWYWWFPSSSFPTGTATTAVERILAPRNLQMSQLVFGMMLFWDLPCGIFTPALRDAAMLAHHIGMLFVAGLALGVLSHGKPLLGYYAPFFFGVIEISSIPLILVDLFHPRHKPWHEYLTSHRAPKWVGQLNDICRIVFAGSFLMLRSLYFPYVTVTGVIPDCLTIRRLPMNQREGVPNLPLDIMMVFNTLFSLLQMYWGYLVVRQIVKLVSKSPSKSDKQA